MPKQTVELPTTDTPSPRARVGPPALAMIASSALCIVVCLVLVVINLSLFFGGAFEEQDPSNGGISKGNQIIFRTIWELIMLAVSFFSLVAGLKMLNMRDYNFAKAGAIFCAMPCFGPCCFLGIPAGIWALQVLSLPEVKASFKSNGK